MKKPKWAQQLYRNKTWKWSKREVQFIRDNSKTLSFREMAKELGRTMSAVKSYADSANIKNTGFKAAMSRIWLRRHRRFKSGKVFGILTTTGNFRVMDTHANDYFWGPGSVRFYEVLCPHGGKRFVRAYTLKSGDSKSCRGWKECPLNRLSRKLNTSDQRRPEYSTVSQHFYSWKKVPSYKKMVFFDGWNPDKVGTGKLIGTKWLLENRPKPGPGWQLHVLKTKKYPYGYFGPDDKDGRHIVWRHKRDRHDQDLLDLLYEMPKKKLRELVQIEIQPFLRAA